MMRELDEGHCSLLALTNLMGSVMAERVGVGGGSDERVIVTQQSIGGECFYLEGGMLGGQ